MLGFEAKWPARGAVRGSLAYAVLLPAGDQYGCSPINVLVKKN
jgi:hypothetical protein